MHEKNNKVNYIDVTETPCTNASKEQLSRLYTRYKFASEFCKDKNILEVACGAGQGLGYLAKIAKKVVGIDIDRDLLEIAKNQRNTDNKIELELADAQALPFKDNTFEIVILYEAIYYFSYPEKFIDEAYRILVKDGIIIICTVNKNWVDFNSSPYSYRYFSAPELYNLIKEGRFSSIQLYGQCFCKNISIKDKIISSIKKMAVNFRLIPKTMKSKELLKRFFFGKLISIPSELYDGMAEYSAPQPISCKIPNHTYKVLYVLGRK